MRYTCKECGEVISCDYVNVEYFKRISTHEGTHK